MKKQQKAKYISVIAVFLALLCGFSAFSIFLPDSAVSLSERRPLAQWQPYEPGGDISAHFSGVDDYLLDQFPLRDFFRSIKALFKKDALFQLDNNGYYCVGGALYKTDPVLRPDAVTDATGKFQKLYETYFADLNANVFYSIIPDKNYFVASENGYPGYDYNEMFALIRENMGAAFSEIEILDALDISDYYQTDPHWDQSKIIPVADAVLSALGAEHLASEFDYSVTGLSPFYGTYYGQAALPVDADTLSYLANSVISGAVVTNFENPEMTDVYDEGNFANTDPYDVFLGGAAALLKIENPAQQNGKQLVIFRDSFGSSLAPLLISEYSEIIVVDIRYVAPSFLGKLVTFNEGCDVLFLYSTSVLNSYGALRG